MKTLINIDNWNANSFLSLEPNTQADTKIDINEDKDFEDSGTEDEE